MSMPDVTICKFWTFELFCWSLNWQKPCSTSMACLLLVSIKSVCLFEHRAGRTSWTLIVKMWCRLCVPVCVTVDWGIFCQMLPQQQQRDSDKLWNNLLPPKNIIHLDIHKLHNSRVQRAPCQAATTHNDFEHDFLKNLLKTFKPTRLDFKVLCCSQVSESENTFIRTFSTFKTLASQGKLSVSSPWPLIPAAVTLLLLVTWYRPPRRFSSVIICNLLICADDNNPTSSSPAPWFLMPGFYSCCFNLMQAEGWWQGRERRGAQTQSRHTLIVKCLVVSLEDSQSREVRQIHTLWDC